MKNDMGCCQVISPVPLQRRIGFLLLLSLVLVFAGGKAILFDTMDPDFFWHYRVAEQLLREGVRPLVDSICFASSKVPWTPYSWLAELGMKALWDRFGLTGAVVIQSTMVVGIFGLIAFSCRQQPTRTTADDLPENDRLLDSIVATALAAFSALPYLSFRPATAATLILSVIASLLLRDRKLGERSRLVWGVPLLTAFCVNIHFFAVFAVLWTGALFAGAIFEHLLQRDSESHRRVRRCLVLLGLTFAGFLATPMLPGMLKVVLAYRTVDPMVHSSQILELVPFWRGIGGAIVAGILGSGLLCILLNIRRLRAGEILWLLGMTLMAVEMGRFLSVAMIIYAPLLAWSLPRLSDRPLQLPLVRNVTAGLLVLCLLRIMFNLPTRDALPTWLNRHGADAPGYPVAAAEYVEKHVTPRSHRLINEFSWGGYLAFRLGDRFQILLDGRTQVHTPEFWRTAYLGTDEQAREVLQAADCDAAILPLHQSRYHSVLLSMGWVCGFKDDRAEVLLPPARLARTGE